MVMVRWFVLLFSIQCLAGASEAHLRAHLEFLASDALQGRESGTRDEWLAAVYIASQMRMQGFQPGGDQLSDGSRSYLQTIPQTRQHFQTPVTVTAGEGDNAVELVHGKNIAFFLLAGESFSGELQLAPDSGEFKVRPGAVIFLPASQRGEGGRDYLKKIMGLAMSGATAILSEYHPEAQPFFDMFGSKPPQVRPAPANVGMLDQDTSQKLRNLKDGAPVSFKGNILPVEHYNTYNVAGYLPGATEDAEAVLLACHLDHLGMKSDKTSGDHIFNGADDDASGVAAMLETARRLNTKTHKRQLWMVAFGSEESGGIGSAYFASKPPIPFEKMAAFVEYEMIGRPNTEIGDHLVWLAGSDRSTLFDMLVDAGANLAADPYPEENYFQRSDNYALAEKGVVAHSVSTYGGHEDYHQVSDEISGIDFKHMERVIDTMVKPVETLLNAAERPKWKPNGKPGPEGRPRRGGPGPKPPEHKDHSNH